MALLWMDDFNGYGTGAAGRDLMLNGAYAEIMGSTQPQPDPDPLATGNALRLQPNFDFAAVRFVLPGTAATVGAGWRMWFEFLPNVINFNQRAAFEFRDASNTILCYMQVMTTGAIRFVRGDNTVLGETAGPVLTANAWQHIEVRMLASATAGTFELRVEGVTRLTLTGLNTSAAGNPVAQVAFSNIVSTITSPPTYWIKDFVVWNTAGTRNNNFLGSVQVLRLLPNGDVNTNWTLVGAATRFGALDNTPPLDATEYIQAGVGPIPPAYRMNISNLPPDVTSVRAVMPVVRARKIDGGDGNIQTSIHSGASSQAGANRPITAAFTYWWDVFEEDPATSAPFTPAAVDALQVSLNRTV